MNEPRKLMSSVNWTFAGAQISPEESFVHWLSMACLHEGSLVLSTAGCRSVPQVGSSMGFSQGPVCRLSLLALLFVKKSGRQGGVVHFQGSPNS